MINKVEVLGCGGAFAPELGNSSFLLWKKDGSAILFDCGGDVFAKLKAKDCLHAIDIVVMSHFHGDHAGSLDTLIYWSYFIQHKTLKVVTAQRAAAINFLKAIDPQLITMVEFSEGDSNILLKVVDHCEKITYSCCAQIGEVFISGDTKTALINDESPICLHEVCFGAKYPNMVHTHYDDLLLSLNKDQKAKYWLYHYNVGDFVKYNEKVKKDGFAGLLQTYDCLTYP